MFPQSALAASEAEAISQNEPGRTCKSMDKMDSLTNQGSLSAAESPDTKEPAIKGRPLVASDDPRLFNMIELAAALGVSRDFIIRMKKRGFKMPIGRATVSMAHRWMEANAGLPTD